MVLGRTLCNTRTAQGLQATSRWPAAGSSFLQRSQGGLHPCETPGVDVILIDCARWY
jgi:hypothetical protein